MRSKSLMAGICAIIILLSHLAIFVSLFYPGYDPRAWGENGWQLLLSSGDLLRSPNLANIVLLIILCSLALPPLAAWTAARFPGRRGSLLAVWFSLPSILVSFFLWMPNLLSFYSANGFLIGPQLLYLVPALGFGLSFMLCLVLAIRLPLIWAREQATLRVHWPDVLASMRDENSERFDFSEEETLPARAGKDFRLPILACCGLLCHLLIFLSLSFPYIDYVDPYGYILDSARYRDAVQPIATTGWQLLGEGFQPPTLPRAAILPPLSPPLAIAILAALILPALIYLACLLLLPVSGPWKDIRLRESIFLSNMFTLIGLGISSIWLLSSWFSYGGDLHDPFQDTDIAFAILPVAFLLSLICSRALLSYFRHRIEKMLH